MRVYGQTVVSSNLSWARKRERVGLNSRKWLVQAFAEMLVGCRFCGVVRHQEWILLLGRVSLRSAVPQNTISIGRPTTTAQAGNSNYENFFSGGFCIKRWAAKGTAREKTHAHSTLQGLGPCIGRPARHRASRCQSQVTRHTGLYLRPKENAQTKELSCLHRTAPHRR